ncbi:hypothetical protein HID58_024964 [Brassica napus]|uniref:Uncharacterized protein n=1 Tax=Brassica napus TaxID=3708 RepID=A0ABQ8CJP3_BRANA|nr:hypothetical protein HID58_024964 [Brassica napus]
MLLSYDCFPRFTQVVIMKKKTAFFSGFQETEALRIITDLQRIYGITSPERLNQTADSYTNHIDGVLSGLDTTPCVTCCLILNILLPVWDCGRSFSSSFVSLSNMDTVIKESSAKETTDVNQLNMIENEVEINTERACKEEVSDQLRGLHGQATTVMLQLPEPVADTLPNCLRVHLLNLPVCCCMGIVFS